MVAAEAVRLGKLGGPRMIARVPGPIRMAG